MGIIEFDEYREFLAEVVAQYEKSAPDVSRYADALYIRMDESPETVSLYELMRVSSLYTGEWMQPNYAANMIYKLRSKLGMDTTGLAGF